MKSELRLAPHSQLPYQNVIEVWYGNQFIATITGADGPGVRIVSKYKINAEDGKSDRIVVPINVIEVKIG